MLIFMINMYFFWSLTMSTIIKRNNKETYDNDIFVSIEHHEIKLKQFLCGFSGEYRVRSYYAESEKLI